MSELAWLERPGLVSSTNSEPSHAPIFLSLGDRRGRRLARLRGGRGDVLAARLPAADAQDTGWSVTGISTAMTIGFLSMAAGQHGLGRAVRQVRAAPRGADRLDRAGGSLALASRATSLASSSS
jgi:hypothetical protein